jgi:hypothetical protein
VVPYRYSLVVVPRVEYGKVLSAFSLHMLRYGHLVNSTIILRIAILSGDLSLRYVLNYHLSLVPKLVPIDGRDGLWCGRIYRWL